MLDFCPNHSYNAAPLRFEWANDFSEGLANVSVNGRSGFIDKEGRFVIPPVYNPGGSYIFGHDIPSYIFNEGLAVVSQGEYPHWVSGCINKSGDVVIPITFQCLYPFSEGLAAFREGELWGYLNTRGEKVIPPRYKSAGCFHDGLAPVQLATGEYRYIDKEGDEVIRRTRNFIISLDEHFPGGCAPFTSAGEFSGGYARVVCYEKAGRIDTSGRFREDKNPGWMVFSEGLGVVHERGKRGYMDTGGNLVIPCRYDNAAPFREGVAAVIVNGKVGYIDHKGQYVVEPVYRRGRNFHEGLAAVEKGGRWGFIDKTGKLVL